ncbi:MAG: hypothetical protein WAL66_16360 [Nitrososphaeraceae archaeon]|jgi:hypothetical protein
MKEFVGTCRKCKRDFSWFGYEGWKAPPICNSCSDIILGRIREFFKDEVRNA